VKVGSLSFWLDIQDRSIPSSELAIRSLTSSLVPSVAWDYIAPAGYCLKSSLAFFCIGQWLVCQSDIPESNFNGQMTLFQWVIPNAEKHFLNLYSYFQLILIFLSNTYALISVTHETSKTHTYTSQAIVMSPSPYTLKSQWFPLICDDPLQLYASHEPPTLSMSLTFLPIPMHQSLEISVCPPWNCLFHVPCYLIYPILIPDHYLRLFLSHCLAHCPSIARYSFVYLIFITYACLLSSCYISVSLVVIPWPIVPIIPIV
jgi:hypothetical protein